MSQPTVVVLGSCNVDFATYAPRLPLAGETLLGTKFHTSFGGKGANQCIAAQKLGARVSIIAKVGADEWGARYKEYLSSEGVDTTHLTFCDDVSTGVAQICVSDDGENHIVVVEGANARLQPRDVEAAAELLRTADVLLAQLETPLDATLRAFQLCPGRRVLNAAPVRGELGALCALASVLCLNRLEAVQLSGPHTHSSTEIAETVEQLLQTGCEHVVVTLGAEGAVFASRSDHVLTHVHTDKVTPVDTTGAGDAFMGALATFLSRDDVAFHQVVGAACSVAAQSVTKEGTHTSYPANFVPFDRIYPHERLPSLKQSL